MNEPPTCARCGDEVECGCTTDPFYQPPSEPEAPKHLVSIRLEATTIAPSGAVIGTGGMLPVTWELLADAQGLEGYIAGHLQDVFQELKRELTLDAVVTARQELTTVLDTLDSVATKEAGTAWAAARKANDALRGVMLP